MRSPSLLSVLLPRQTGYIDEIGFETDQSELASKGFYVQSAASRALDAFGKLTNIYTSVSKLLGSTSRVRFLLTAPPHAHPSFFFLFFFGGLLMVMLWLRRCGSVRGMGFWLRWTTISSCSGNSCGFLWTIY